MTMRQAAAQSRLIYHGMAAQAISELPRLLAPRAQQKWQSLPTTLARCRSRRFDRVYGWYKDTPCDRRQFEKCPSTEVQFSRSTPTGISAQIHSEE